MKSIMLRDKFGTPMKGRLDDLTLRQSILIEMAIKTQIKNIEEFIDMEKRLLEEYKDDEEVAKRAMYFIESSSEELRQHNEILNSLGLKNETTIKLDCYEFETEKMSINTMLKKYKKI